jgi:hypothetical protein
MPSKSVQPEPCNGNGGEAARLEVLSNSYGTVGPDSDWWVNEPLWDQAVRRLTAPPLPPPAAAPAHSDGAVHGTIHDAAAGTAGRNRHPDLERN